MLTIMYEFWKDIQSVSFLFALCSAGNSLQEQLPEEVEPQFEAKYHEVGIVKEGNRITGAIVKEGTVQNDTEWRYVSYEEFLSLVKRREIKHLQWDEDKNRIALRKAKVNSSIENIHSVDSYFKHDVIFNCRPDKNTIPCAICNILQVDKVDTITMLIASGEKTDKLFQLIQQFVTAEPKPIKYTNSIRVILPFHQFQNFVITLIQKRFQVSYCMETAENFTLQHAYKNKIPKKFRESPEFVYEQVRRMIL